MLKDEPEAAPERETCCEMYGCSKDMLMCTACCRRRLCPECTLRCSQRRLDPAELRDFCARFTQSGADVSATAAVADFKCPFCRSVEPLSEREVCLQSMMIAIGPLFRANESKFCAEVSKLSKNAQDNASGARADVLRHAGRGQRR